MINLFCGYDAREAVGFHVFTASVLRHASAPVAIHALDSKGLPQGSNSFTFSRFLVPSLMGFKGHAIFADACDMLMLDDIAKLDALFDPQYAMQVVKHDVYTSQHPRKYVGTEMECEQTNYPRKNWASLMVINCAHEAWAGITPNRIVAARGLELLQLRFAFDKEIGCLPDGWNRLVDEGQSLSGASIAHWTAGIPAFAHYANAPGADLWFAHRNEILAAA